MRGLGEDKTRAPIFFFYSFFLASKHILQRQEVGKTDLGLSYFLGEMDSFFRKFAYFSTFLLLCNGLFSF